MDDESTYPNHHQKGACDEHRQPVLTHDLREGYFVETGRFTGGMARLTYGETVVPVDVDALLG